MAIFHSGRWNTGTNPDLTFVGAGPDSRAPDRRIFEKFPRSQHRRSLIVPPRLALPVPSKPVKRWNFRKANWSNYNALTNKLAKSLLPPDQRMWIWPTRISAMSSEKQPKILSHAIVEITTYRVGMLSARTRDVEAVIFQPRPLPHLALPLPLTENEKTTVDNFFNFCGSVACFLLHFIILKRQKPSFIAITLPTSLELIVPNYSMFLFLGY